MTYKRAQVRCQKAWLKFLKYGCESTYKKWLRASADELDVYHLLLDSIEKESKT